MTTKTSLAALVAALAFAHAACGGPRAVDPAHTETTGATGSTGSSGGDGSGPTGGTGGASSGGGLATLDALLAALDADRDGTLLKQSREGGWPAAVDGGYLVVSTNLARANVAGDFSNWGPLAMSKGDDFAWLVVPAHAGDRYKFTDGASDWVADPWSRAYGYDDHGEMSSLPPSSGAHLERYVEVGGAGLEPRTVRVWLPQSTPTRVLYAHDGQNLFDPEAIWGGWKLADAAPDGTLIVGIDNTPARMDEYTHVSDDIGDGPIGGKASAYGTFLQTVVRPLIATHYGEPSVRGLMGSSLGGLVSLAVADQFPGEFHFAASLSGTLGWGSIGDGVHHETMTSRYHTHGHQTTVLYVDSGGGGTCKDADGDGVDDDGTGSDNYCENLQFEKALVTLGYTEGKDLFTWYEAGATHDEAHWAARVFRPLEIFAKIGKP